jgi:hypothetical protein
MDLTRYDDPVHFVPQAEPFLLAHEAAHCLPLGLCATLLAQPDAAAPPPYLAIVNLGAHVVIVALRTPPHNVVLSLIPDLAHVDAAMALLAADLRLVYGARLPGVLGPSTISRAFAARWELTTGQRFRPGMRERIYRLDAVRPVSGVPGHLRRATQLDRDLLLRWGHAFDQEALGGRESSDVEALVDRMLTFEQRGAYLWDDGQPVSLAAYGGPTTHGIRIGPVYTPPERRGRGYASAAVAGLSQRLLDDGRQFCTLFTNLANPTSNHIYQTIGYTPVCDMDEYQFDLTN